MITIDDIADYIIHRSAEDGRPLNLLKLQKLAYYVQAWHLALYYKPLTSARFQAWVHGPVSRQLYDRFKSNMLYDVVTVADIRPGFSAARLPQEAREFMNAVLDEYGKFSGSQLEELTHKEKPWADARVGFGEFDRCENEISEETMGAYYRARLLKQPPQSLI